MKKSFAFLSILIIYSCQTNNSEKISFNKDTELDIDKVLNIKSNQIPLYSEEELFILTENIILRTGGNSLIKRDSILLEKGIDFMNYVIKMNPKNKTAFFNKLGLHQYLKEYDQAIQTIDSNFYFNGIFFEGLIGKGFLYEKISLSDSSKKCFSEALSIVNNKIEKSDYQKDLKDYFLTSRVLLYLLLEDSINSKKEMEFLLLTYPDNKQIIKFKEWFYDGFNKDDYIEKQFK